MIKTKIFKIVILLFFTSVSFSQEKLIDICKTKLDTTKFILTEKYENFLKQLMKGESLKIKNERSNSNDILATKEQALFFARFIVFVKAPIDTNWPKEFSISEDKTRNFWFVNCKFIGIPLDGNFRMIITKKNCRLLFYF